MKKLVILITMLSMVLTSCSQLDGPLINPNIIGVGKLQHDTKSDSYFVVIDSMQYTIAKVTVPDDNPHTWGTTQDITPVEGMFVTVFTSSHCMGIQAVTGRKSAEQIEELYHRNGTGVVIMVGILLACLIGMIVPDRDRIEESEKTNKA